MEQALKTTPLTETHIQLGAKMAPFAGYHMPISYTTLTEEHMAVRERAGLFDVAHMGEFLVTGTQALDLIQYVTSNNASRLKPGDAQYSCLPNEGGGIVDDLLVYRFEDKGEIQRFLLVVNASNMDKDFKWIEGHNSFDAKVENRSDETGLLALQGPLSTDILGKLTSTNIEEIPYYKFKIGEVAGIKNVIISATGYTGSGGYELYVPNEYLKALWDALMEAGEEFDLLPAGLGARDTLRLEMGYCLYGNDIDDGTSPLEAGLGWITKTKKGDFVGKDEILALKEAGLSRKLVAFEVEGRRVPRHDYPIVGESGEIIGKVTSGTLSPSLGIPIGLGYVPIECARDGVPFFVQAGKKLLKAKLRSLPFYKPEPI